VWGASRGLANYSRKLMGSCLPRYHRWVRLEKDSSGKLNLARVGLRVHLPSDFCFVCRKRYSVFLQEERVKQKRRLEAAVV
jgi:hypothetical protein